MEPPASTPLRVAVIGGGAFGRNHLRVYSELASADNSRVTLSALVEPNPIRRADLAAHYNIPAFGTVDDFLRHGPRAHAASICVPTVAHAEVATSLLEAGLDVLIEKPITTTLVEADGLIRLAARLGRILAVGHLERFNPAVTACLDRLTRPMFFEAHRLSVFTPRSLDIDVVLDLMIHDIDIVLAFCCSGVHEVRAVGLPVLSPKVDIANARIEFSSGCIANFTASRVSTEQVRKLRFFQPREYLSLDFARQELLSIQVDAAALASAPSALPHTGHAGKLAHPSPGLSIETPALHRTEPLRLELQDFLQAVHHRTPPRVTGEAGREALALALEINREIASHARRAGLSTPRPSSTKG